MSLPGTCRVTSAVCFQFFNGKNDGNTRHLVEMANHRVQLVFHVLAQRWCNFDVMATDLQIHFFSSHYRVLRKLTGGMLSSSRYFATVRRYNDSLLA
jgi:hypothetical protein